MTFKPSNAKNCGCIFVIESRMSEAFTCGDRIEFHPSKDRLQVQGYPRSTSSAFPFPMSFVLTRARRTRRQLRRGKAAPFWMGAW